MLIQLLATAGLATLITRGGGGEQTSKVKLPATFKFNGQPLRTGPDNGFNTLFTAKKTDSAAVLAKSKNGEWLFVWSDSGDGWAHHTTINLQGDANTLPVWPNAIRGYIYKPEGSIKRPTDMMNGPDSAYELMVCVPAGQYVKILAQSEDGHWLFIWSDAGDGWVPKSSVETKADLSFLATWATPIKGAKYKPKGTVTAAHTDLRQGADWKFAVVAQAKKGTEVKVMAKDPSGAWLFIWADVGDGWVAANTIETEGDVDKMAVWKEPMKGAAYSR